MNEEELRQLELDLKNAKAEYVKAKKVLDNILSLEIRYQETSSEGSFVVRNKNLFEGSWAVG